jgi:ribosomal peptide maturation radical SAM protein 1
MLKLSLINMPFAALQMPSIALTQLKSVLEPRFQNQVSVDVHYLNLDFALEWGLELYEAVTTSMESQNSGLGEWLFRHVAFPEVEDNPEAYFRRYYPYRTPQMEMMKRAILEMRQKVEPCLENMIQKYDLEHAQIVGFTSMFAQNTACFALARKLKELNPQIITVMGGANCETPMGQELVKHVPQLDYVFSGPSLINFPSFVQYCIEGETEKCSDIKGVFSKKNYGLKPLQSTIGEELDINVPVELDYHPFMDRIKTAFPGGQVKPSLLFETSRGCWWGERAHCTFCGLNGMTMNYRSMSPQRALSQFDSLFQYSPACSRYESVDNILPKTYFEEVLPFVGTPPDAHIFYEVKADLSEQDVQVLSRARVKIIQPGIEALASSTLKLMKKGTTSFQNICLLKNCAQYDIKPLWNLLVGFPGEAEEVFSKYLADIPLLFHLPPPTGAYPVRFDRYSPYYVQAKQYNLNLHPLHYYQFIYPFSQETLANMAYYFQDLNVNAPYIETMIKWIDKLKEQIKVWLARWHGWDQGLPPRLYFKENLPNVVYDSRSGEVIEHDVGELGRQVLDQIAQKQSGFVKLTAKLGHIADFDAAREIDRLQKKRLVFQEGRGYLSLVLPEKPPLPSM